MIPHIIHYCWLSNEPIPENLQRCIDSWSKYCPDCKIVKWDTTMFDINSVSLVKDAYENRKWAFAADYIRIYALYNMGGIYLDSDVMLYDNIFKYLDDRFVSAVEYHPKVKDLEKNVGLLDNDGRRIGDNEVVASIGVQAAVIASEPKHPLLAKCLEFYKGFNLETLLAKGFVAPNVIAYNAEEYGFKYCDKEQHLAEGIHLYTTKIISHFDQYNRKSVAVHYCAGSWVKKNTLQKCLQFVKDNKVLFYLYTKVIQVFRK